MFVFVFERALFRFRANTPALDVFVQLPPRLGSRNGPHPKTYTLCDLIQPPSMRPISAK